MTTTSDSGRLFKVGVNAYKAGEYEKAIASLQPLLRDSRLSSQSQYGLGASLYLST